MHRDKFPEKVPFRLTRMMVKAMEVSGIEGNFRQGCVCGWCGEGGGVGVGVGGR
jgi:phosphatidylinositol kinase/protein kinase (PI-3  family)